MQAAIKFGNEIVLCVYTGDKPTGGYEIAVTAVTLRGQEIGVTIDMINPPRGAMLTQAITSPYAIYRITLPEDARQGDDISSFRFLTAQDSSPQPITLHRLP